MTINKNFTDLVGNTPLLELWREISINAYVL